MKEPILINILGSEWTIKETNVQEDGKLHSCNGYCDPSTKTIVLDDAVNLATDPTTIDNLDFNKFLTYRHEIVHAFLQESGLSELAHNELVVEWMAIQFPKIYKVFETLGCLGV